MSEEKEMFEFLEDRGLFNNLYAEPFNNLYAEPTEPLKIMVDSNDDGDAYPTEVKKGEKGNKLGVLWQLLLHKFGQEDEYHLSTTIISINALIALTIILFKIWERCTAIEQILWGLAEMIIGIAVVLLMFGKKMAVIKTRNILGIRDNQDVYVVTYYGVEKAKLVGVDYKEDDGVIFCCEHTKQNEDTHWHWFSKEEIFLDKSDACVKYDSQMVKRVSVLSKILEIDETRARNFLMSASFIQYAKKRYYCGNDFAYYQNENSDAFFMSEKEIFNCLKEIKATAAEKQKKADIQKSRRENAIQTFNQMFEEE